MNMLLIFIALTGLLFSGTDSFKISEKEYENIDRMMQFGVQVFLNCLDKVKEATEKLVKDDVLRTNRIAIQEHWTSFRDTANRISVEERGKGEQDDILAAARTVRRLVLHYKDDVKKMFHSLTTEQSVQLYLPVINMFKGTIERAKVKEIWGTLVANYLPGAPQIESEPLEFLCYLLSTNAAETYVVSALKFGEAVISEVKQIDLDEISARVRSTSLTALRKFNEIEKTEREKESDRLLVTISVTSKVLIFYWERYLNFTESPALQERYEEVVSQVEDNYLLVIYNLLTPLMEWDTVKELWNHLMDFSEEFFLIGLGMLRNFFYYAGEERCARTVRVLRIHAVANAYYYYTRLSEKGVFNDMEKMYLNAVNKSVALIGKEEVQYFREASYEKSMAFLKELNSRTRQERRKPGFLLPQMRAIAQMFLIKSEAVIDRFYAAIDDDTVRSLSMNWANLKAICPKKLLASGVLTQDQLDQAERIFINETSEFFGKFEELTSEIDKKMVEDAFKALVKLVIVGLNSIYAPLAQVWDTIVV